MEQIKILQHFPYLISKENYSLYVGFIYIQEQEFKITLKVPNYPMLYDMDIKIFYDGTLVDIQLGEFDLNLNLYTFLLQLEKKLSSVLSTKPQNQLKINLKFIKECEDLISNYDLKLQISSDLTEVLLKDDYHYLKAQRLDSGGYAICEHSLPDLSEGENCRVLKSGLSLEALYKIFKHNLQMLERYYRDLDEIDLVCCVIDPPNPTTKESYRQILLGEYIINTTKTLVARISDKYLKCYIEDNTSVIVRLSPWAYGGCPDLTFIGPIIYTDKLIENVSHNMQNWNNDVNLFRNLLSLLDLMYFPTKRIDNINNDKNDALIVDGECSICFASRLDNELPNIVCANKSCGLYYHVKCLFEWFTSMSSSRTNLDFIQGSCPNCNQIISCPVRN